jgi:hypothetical protein
MYTLTAAVRANNLGLLDVGEMVLLGEFLVTILAVIDILRHGRGSGEHDSAVCLCMIVAMQRWLAVDHAECHTHQAGPPVQILRRLLTPGCSPLKAYRRHGR